MDHFLELMRRREFVACIAGVIAFVVCLILDQQSFNGRYFGVDVLAGFFVAVAVWLAWPIWGPKEVTKADNHETGNTRKP